LHIANFNYSAVNKKEQIIYCFFFSTFVIAEERKDRSIPKINAHKKL